MTQKKNSRQKNTVKLSLLKGDLSGKIAVYLNDTRITGCNTKPLGGGTIVYEEEINKEDIRKLLDI